MAGFASGDNVYKNIMKLEFSKCVYSVSEDNGDIDQLRVDEYALSRVISQDIEEIVNFGG